MQGRDLLSKWELNQLYWHEGSQVFPVCEMLKSLTYKNFVQTDGQIFSRCVCNHGFIASPVFQWWGKWGTVLTIKGKSSVHAPLKSTSPTAYNHLWVSICYNPNQTDTDNSSLTIDESFIRNWCGTNKCGTLSLLHPQLPWVPILEFCLFWFSFSTIKNTSLKYKIYILFVPLQRKSHWLDLRV